MFSPETKQKISDFLQFNYVTPSTLDILSQQNHPNDSLQLKAFFKFKLL